MKTMKKNVKIIICDNADENKTLEENRRNNFEEINFEFTSTGNSQKNGVLERGFATLYSRMCVMMLHAVIHENLKSILRSGCMATATKLENIMVNPHK